ncbi:MAG: thioesterase family protein [Candidatus Gastranaerophilales bacterium]
MKKHIFEQKVYYADTDAYGVVWHGNYFRWLEAGRVDWCEMFGYNLIELQKQDIVLPVVNINTRFKMSAKLNDNLIIETEVAKFNGLSVTFKQVIKSKDTGKAFIEAEIEVVAISNDGKLHRRMPKLLADIFEKELEQCHV